MKLGQKNFAHVALFCTVVAACGGNGGGPTAAASTPAPVPTPVPTSSPTPTPSPSSANPDVQGIFYTTGSGHASYTTILETGEFYSFDTWNGWTGLEHGYLTGTALQFSSGSVALYNFGDAPGGFLTFGSASGSYISSTLTLSVSFTAVDNYTYSGTQKSYAANDARTLYDNPISIADLAGHYRGVLYGVGGKINAAVTPQLGLAINGPDIAADGSFNISFSDCLFSGSLSPRGSKGVFNLLATVSGATCDFEGQMNGILTPISYSSLDTRLIFQLLNGDDTKSIVLYLQKS